MTEFIGKKISNNEYLYTNNGFKKTGLPNPDGTITSFVPTFDSLSAIPSGFVGTATSVGKQQVQIPVRLNLPLW